MSQIATQAPASPRFTHGSGQSYPAIFSDPVSLVARRSATLPGCRRICLNRASPPLWSRLPAGRTETSDLTPPLTKMAERQPDHHPKTT